MHSPTRIQPKFSIITVTYNAGKVLEALLTKLTNRWNISLWTVGRKTIR